MGQLDLFRDLAALMSVGGRGVDYINVDGGEGGTDARPLVFEDHVALPFKVLTGVPGPCGSRAADDVVFTGGEEHGLPENALLAFALGCDTVNVGRESMLSIGCIQAQGRAEQPGHDGVADLHARSLRLIRVPRLRTG